MRLGGYRRRSEVPIIDTRRRAACTSARGARPPQGTGQQLADPNGQSKALGGAAMTALA